jgi:hypothetical protein
MPAMETVRRFAAQVLSGDHAGAIRDGYTPDASMQETRAPRRRGRDALAARERARLERRAHFETQLLADPLISGSSVVLRWRFTFFPKSGGERSLEEFALQARQGDRFAAETLCYDPAQMKA